MKIYKTSITPVAGEGYRLEVEIRVPSAGDAILLQTEIARLLERMTPASSPAAKRGEITSEDFEGAFNFDGATSLYSEGVLSSISFELPCGRRADVALRHGNCHVSVGGGAFAQSVVRYDEAYRVSCDEMRYQFLYDACKRAAHLVIEDQERSERSRT